MRYHRSLAAVAFLAAVGGFAFRSGERHARAADCHFNTCSVIHAWQHQDDWKTTNCTAAFGEQTPPEQADRKLFPLKAILTGKSSVLTVQYEEGSLTSKGSDMWLYNFSKFSRDCNLTAPPSYPTVGLETGTPAKDKDGNYIRTTAPWKWCSNPREDRVPMD